MLIKEFFKSFFPQWLLDLRNTYLKSRYQNAISRKNHNQVFDFIYRKKIWGDKESISGSGSSVAQTSTITKEIPKLLKKYNINSLLDLPCGDFNWMQYVDLEGIKYIGGDIVGDIIQKNILLFQSPDRTFLQIDIIKDQLPKADLILCRDCFVHLNYELIFKSIDNLKRQNFKYLLTTSFTDKIANHNITTGDWRPLNLEIEPFNLRKIAVINENCTEGGLEFSDKSLILIDLTSPH
jgi:hypothetical protein